MSAHSSNADGEYQLYISALKYVDGIEL